ncbi:MAG: TonB-dependent siderophore receptor [Acidobacteriaceae bacterium]
MSTHAIAIVPVYERFLIPISGKQTSLARHSRASIAAALMLLACLTTSQSALSQSTSQQSKRPKSAASTPQLPRVVTSIEVHSGRAAGYLPDAISTGNLDGASIKETPLSVTVVTQDLMTDQFSRVLSDLVKNDASIGEDYAPVGYYGDFEIRGFPIDLATALQINGLTIAGEQDVPLENKQQVEFLKGVAGLESGVSSAGGVINYITKPPAAIKAIDLATDHRGGAYGAVDLGGFLGSKKQLGLRVNLAGEKIQSYVKDANGWRAMGAIAADWILNSRLIVKSDFEYQHKVQRSVCGYQLLGGTTVPDPVYPSTMLGEQSWSKPNTFDTFNTSVRLDYALHHNWHAFAAAGYSQSLIDDNVVYAYGCYYEAACTLPGGSPPWFFAPDGTYDIYDYRDPGELRIDAQAKLMVTGHVKTGAIRQDLAAGEVVFRRSVQLPSRAVYDYVGSENVYQPVRPVPIESISGAPDEAGPRVLYEDNHQAAAVLQDRMHLPGRIQLIAGGRFDSVRDHNYAGDSTTDKIVWLPRYAALFNPMKRLTLYGSYSVQLSLGPQAPFWAGGFYLPPFYTRQVETGAKFQPVQRLLVTVALFRMRAPFFYPKTVDDLGDQNFVSEGRETHDGIELNAQGRATGWMRLTASAAAIRALSDHTGTPAFDNKQVINVPRLRTALFADVALDHTHRLHLMPGWSYTGRKEATRDDTVSVPGYNIFNLGVRYTPGGEQGHVSFRLYAENTFDKRYWKDTGASYGDTFIHLGAPTTVHFSTHYTF